MIGYGGGGAVIKYCGGAASFSYATEQSALNNSFYCSLLALDTCSKLKLSFQDIIFSRYLFGVKMEF